MGCTTCTLASAHRRSEFHDQYTVGEQLGEGSFGKVFVVHRNSLENEEQACKQALSSASTSPTPAPFCVKMLCAADKNPTIERRLSRCAFDEVMIWRRIGRNGHCVDLIDAFVQEKSWYIVMEKCDGSLLDKLSYVQSILETDFRRIFREMLLGVQHLHQAGIVHRDVKADNFLLGGPCGTSVKLGDFGLATQMPFDRLLTGSVGTPPLMSPEMLAQSGYDYKTDVWSLGGTIHFLLCQEYPYSVGNYDADAVKSAILFDSPKLSLSWVDGSLSFIKCMLQRKQAHRYTAQQLLMLPSFNPNSSSPHISLREVRRLYQRAIAGVQWMAPIAGEKERPAVMDVRPSEVSTAPSLQHWCLQDESVASLRDGSRSPISRPMWPQ
eukprot:TRINITY_DN41867_c0_g1_i1.p1 TRINITY_DN41867_c0_g1~~TRINITY_DN41867_c0_g1_i1.p1  ORF type:complete len:397 (-),score=47.73 TRINITY_DN41867_c0_g1_i1:58-1200(-)